ncbi:MAG: hypothetical protein AAF311_09670 [Pseudomonadota bacterium]
MADIPVEYRPDYAAPASMPVWAGLLGLLALAALIWILFSLGSSAAPEADAGSDPVVAQQLQRTPPV